MGLNRYERNSSPTAAEIEGQLRVPAAATIPNASRKADKSIDQGVPLPEIAQRGRIASALDSIVVKLTGSSSVGSTRRW